MEYEREIQLKKINEKCKWISICVVNNYRKEIAHEKKKLTTSICFNGRNWNAPPAISLPPFLLMFFPSSCIGL